MKFYDLGINSTLSIGADEPEVMLKTAYELGFAGVAFADFKNILPKEIKQLRKEYQGRCEIYTRVTIVPKSVNHMKQMIKNTRNHVDFIAVKSDRNEKNIYINAILDKRVDIISLSEVEELRSLEYSHFKMAKENLTVVEIVTRNLIKEEAQKSRFLRIMSKACVQLIRAKAPFIISSGAQQKWELRAPGELIALAGLVKIPEKHVISAISSNPRLLIQKHEMIRDPNHVMAGVRVVSLGEEE